MKCNSSNKMDEQASALHNWLPTMIHFNNISEQLNCHQYLLYNRFHKIDIREIGVNIILYCRGGCNEVVKSLLFFILWPGRPICTRSWSRTLSLRIMELDSCCLVTQCMDPSESQRGAVDCVWLFGISTHPI